MAIYNVLDPVTLTVRLPDGTLAPTAEVLLNGVNITNAVTRLIIDATPSRENGGLPRVTLELRHLRLYADVSALVNELILPPRPEAQTPDREDGLPQ